MFSVCGMSIWLKSLLLEDPDPSVRREICTGIYRLCLGSASNGKTGLDCISPVLSILLQYLGQAQLMKPHRRESLIQPGPEEPGKEPFGPACRDYFWVLAKLVENIKETQAVDPEALVQKLIHGISTRPLYERRNGASVDDALIGMMNLLCALLKQTPSLKVSPACQQFVKKLFSFLYALPSPGDKLVPKCKSPQTRSACYDLVVELVKGCLENYKVLHTLLIQQHNPGSHKPYPWEYWPLEDGRSECGYVGLVNLGATCYMATCVQQLFMIPAIRDCVLQTDVLGAAVHPLFGKHQATLHELRRMFAYLLESERKSYNPLSFCKTYTMDNQPLNTGEQKDMAEFFIDLLSKMEEM
ncbi:ubiquitin carboxyl-terminal hydrolase puf, partial [Eurytemora carolleeae]|uniref:ubiquitin carboxyl-terminal hydrolase puf n=1 Tax=Eurytemora carolleeae TaxID=1294199 RepID=UPI000C77899A